MLFRSIVTVVPLIVQTPLGVMVGVRPEFDVATTENVDKYVASAGAPVKLTVCLIGLATVVSSVMVGAGGQAVLPAWFAVTAQYPVLATIVNVAPTLVQTRLPLNETGNPELAVAATMKLLL